MEILKLVNHINLTSDEDFTLIQIIGFLNDAIAKINIECSANYPFIEDDLPLPSYAFEEYTALPDTWIRALLVPFASGRIKENDSSQFEYSDWYSQFDINLTQFQSRYEIPLQYVDLDSSGNRVEEDYSLNIFTHMKGW